MTENRQVKQALRKGSITSPDYFEDEIPGWIWVLTVQGDLPEHLEPLAEEDDLNEFGGDIVGCYITQALLKADMVKLGVQRYGIFHMKLEGWQPK